MFEDIGKVVFFHRTKGGLSRNALATFAGVGKTAIFDLENGVKSTRLDTLEKILKVLNIQLVLKSPLMNAYEEAKNAKGDSSHSQRRGRKAPRA